MKQPVLQALILAERIYTDRSGRKIIAGTFNALRLKPANPPEEFLGPDGTKKLKVEGGDPGAPWVYISLTDVWDGTRLGLQFVSLTKNEVLFETDITVPCKDRLATKEIVLPLPRLDVPEPGVYAFEVVCEGEVIGSHRIVARLAESPPERQGEP